MSAGCRREPDELPRRGDQPSRRVLSGCLESAKRTLDEDSSRTTRFFRFTSDKRVRSTASVRTVRSRSFGHFHPWQCGHVVGSGSGCVRARPGSCPRRGPGAKGNPLQSLRPRRRRRSDRRWTPRHARSRELVASWQDRTRCLGRGCLKRRRLEPGACVVCPLGRHGPAYQRSLRFHLRCIAHDFLEGGTRPQRCRDQSSGLRLSSRPELQACASRTTAFLNVCPKVLVTSNRPTAHAVRASKARLVQPALLFHEVTRLAGS